MKLYLMIYLCANAETDLNYLPLFALLISAISLRLAYVAFISNTKLDFRKKQVDSVINLIQTIHNSPFEFHVLTYSQSPECGIGRGGSVFKINLFELAKLNEFRNDIFEKLQEEPIYFDIESNQIAGIKKHIDDPFLPIEISDFLVAFYAIPPTFNVYINEVVGVEILVVNSKYYEPNIFDNQEITPTPVLRNPKGFAFNSFENMIACSNNLEIAIRNWFKEQKVTELNIRKDFKEI